MKKAYWIPRSMFFRMLWPSFISSLALAVADVADALVVGSRMGEKGLAAIGIVTPVYMLYNLIGYGFASGGCVTHGMLTAQGRDEAALCHFRTLTCWLLLLSAAIAVLGNVFMIPFLSLLGVDGRRPDLLALSMEYARPLVGAAPIFFLNFLLYDFVRSDNAPELASLGFSLGCAVDLGLNILLVLVLGMGVLGSILSTVAAQVVSIIVLSIHFFRKRGILRLKSVLSARSDRAEIRKLSLRSLRIGFSASLRNIFQFLFLFLSNRFLLRAGDLGLIDGDLYVAVFDLVMNVSFVAQTPYAAISETLQPLGAVFTQEHDRKSLRYVLRLSQALGLGMELLLGGLLACFAGAVSGMFGLTDAPAQAVSIPAIRIFFLSMPFAGALIVLTGYFQSSGQEKMSSVVTLLRNLLIQLPVTVLFGLRFPSAFWWLFPVYEAASLLAVLAILRFRPGRKEDALAVFNASLDNTNHELGRVLSSLEAFCRSQDIPLKKAVQLQTCVEELCLVTMEQAFTGRPDEYIRITLARESRDTYTLYLRNSAPRFNPFKMETGRLQRLDEEKLMESMGVLLVKEHSTSLHYRNYEGFNVLTVTLGESA